MRVEATLLKAFYRVQARRQSRANRVLNSNFSRRDYNSDKPNIQQTKYLLLKERRQKARVLGEANNDQALWTLGRQKVGASRREASRCFSICG
jgi:hypothetical protein